jgi:hypothetical protein
VVGNDCQQILRPQGMLLLQEKSEEESGSLLLLLLLLLLLSVRPCFVPFGIAANCSKENPGRFGVFDADP